MHLEAALQDGETGGSSLTGMSFICAEPDQLFLIKTHFATCSNVSRLGTCVCHPCRENPVTDHPAVTLTESQGGSEPQTGPMKSPDLRLVFPERHSVGKHRRTPLPPWEVDTLTLVGILILAVVLIIKQCLDFSHFFALHYKCISGV